MNWNESEEIAICRLYSLMARLESLGQLGRGKDKTTKAELIRGAQSGALADRSRGSIEAKLMNVTHCRKLAGLSIVTGYKPLPNCSQSLLDAFDVSRAESKQGANRCQ